MTYRYAVKIAYDGRPFHGFARQPNVTTVEGTILHILKEKNIIQDASIFRYASRTDKGVSAFGNVIVFSTPQDLDELQHLLGPYNHLLFYAITQVNNDFFPRYAQVRQYQYYLPQTSIQLEDLMNLLTVFTGEHDFTNFARIEPGKNPIRSINNIVVSSDNSFFIITFYAQTFLWHQIRRIVGAIISYSQGKIVHSDITQALSNPMTSVDFGIAPSENLVLSNVIYDISFSITGEMKQLLHDFEQQIITQL